MEGQAYLIRVSAENEVGVGSPVELASPVKAKSRFGE